jgi:hypothetical protein
MVAATRNLHSLIGGVGDVQVRLREKWPRCATNETTKSHGERTAVQLIQIARATLDDVCRGRRCSAGNRTVGGGRGGRS